MDFATILLSLHGKGFAFAFIDHSTQYFYALTFPLQCIVPRRGKFLFRLQGPILAKYYDGDNHQQYDLGQVLGHSLYAQLVHSALYCLLVEVGVSTTSYLSSNKLPCYYQKQQWGRLHCDHLGGCWYHLVPCITFKISLFMLLIIILFADLIFTFMRTMIGERTHRVGVFFGEEDPHTFYMTCSKRRMGRDMASTTKSLFLHEEGHVMDGFSYNGDFLPIKHEMVWVSLMHSTGKGTFGGLVPSLPIKSNSIAAQDQKNLYIHLKWRGR